jgi:hypothetical protein
MPWPASSIKPEGEMNEFNKPEKVQAENKQFGGVAM